MTTDFSPVGPRALIRAKHVTELQEAIRRLEAEDGATQVIDIRNRNASTVSSDNTTALNAAAVEAAGLGAVLWIPEGTWRGSIDAVSHLRIAGPGTLKAQAGAAASRQAVIRRESAATDIWISDITIDGNGIVQGAKFEGTGGPTLTASGMSNVTITNTGTADNFNRAVTLNDTDGFTLRRMRMLDVYSGLAGNSSQNLTVDDLEVDGTVSNGIGMTAWAAIPGLVLRNVRMRNINRMGIELLGGSGGYWDAPVFDGMWVEIDPSATAGTEAFAYSLVGIRAALGSNLYGDAGSLTPDYVFEIAGEHHQFTNLQARGAGSGFATNNASRVHFANAVAVENITGFATVGGDANDGHRYTACTALNCRDRGWSLDTIGSGRAGHVLKSCAVERSIAWSGDASRTFEAVRLEDFTIPATIEDMEIIQGQASPTSGFGFRGYAAYVGSNADLGDTVIRRTRFIDKKSGGLMTAYFANSGAGFGDMVREENFAFDASWAKTAANS